MNYVITDVKCKAMDIVMNNVMALSICKVMDKGKCKGKINLMIMQWSIAMVEKRLRSLAIRHIKIHITLCILQNIYIYMYNLPLVITALFPAGTLRALAAYSWWTLNISSGTP